MARKINHFKKLNKYTPQRIFAVGTYVATVQMGRVTDPPAQGKIVEVTEGKVTGEFLEPRIFNGVTYRRFSFDPQTEHFWVTVPR